MDVLMLKEITLEFLTFAGLYFLCINALHGILLALSWVKIRKFSNKDSSIETQNPQQAVSFIIPAFNEESLIVETIQTYLSLPQKKEIIIINDGSKDQTFKMLQTMFFLKRSDVGSNLFRSITHPELVVIEADHKGKAFALNLGIQKASFELICTLDADTIPSRKGVSASMNAFMANPNLVAAGGIIHVLNSNTLKGNTPQTKSSNLWLTNFQSIEYLKTFICVRLGWSLLGSTTLISGAFCMFKKEAWRKVGGFRNDSITEDLDFIIKLRRAYPGKNNHFRILPVVTCHTQVPKDKKHLMVQRMRWQMGLVETLFKNLDLCFNRNHGIVGLVTIPYYWIAEVLSPLIEIFALIVVPFALIQGWIELSVVATFLLAGLILNISMTLFGIYLDNEHVSGNKSRCYRKGLFHGILIHFGYKQLTSWWRFLALLRAFKKGYQWGEKPRQEITHQSL
jgi:cellulose synthase/poly-beta-1,6-N-acetylglucosamine synthase-like glycosyltransferase